MAGEATEWTSTEIEYGRFSIENEKLRVEVFSDFSGQVTDVNGNTIAFQDLRVFIDAGKLLEVALVEHYGGYK